MNDEAEPFGGFELLEPSAADKPSSSGSPRKTEAVQPSSRPATAAGPSQGVRVVRNTQMYREPTGISKTVTIDGRDQRDGGQQPTTSTAPPDEEPRGYGRNKLNRLTLRIGKKQLTFKITDVPPEQPNYEWDQFPTPDPHRYYTEIPLTKRRCGLCQRMYYSMDEFRRHIAEGHLIAPFSCHACQRTFATRNDFYAHARSHGDRPHECHACGKRFRHPPNLQQHLKLHEAGNRHFCNMCGKCFRSNDDLANHHTRCPATGRIDRPHRYECDFCAKPFHQRRDKFIHERVHTGERPYECGYCGRGFTQSQALTSHIRLHTGEKPYTCRVCGSSFRDCSALRKHDLIHTNSERQGTTEEDMEQVEEEEGEEGRIGGGEYGDEKIVHDGDVAVMEEVEEEVVEEGEIALEEVYGDYEIG